MKKIQRIGLIIVAVAAHACGTQGDPAAGTDFRVNVISTESTDISTTCNSGGVRLFQKTSASTELESKSPNEDSPPIDVQLDSYEIEYTPLDGGPELTGHVYPFEVSYLVPGNGKLTVDLEMVPINTKKQYFNSTTGTTSFTKISVYQAHYVFRGTTEYEEPVRAEGDITFVMGNNYVVDCSGQ